MAQNGAPLSLVERVGERSWHVAPDSWQNIQLPLFFYNVEGLFSFVGYICFPSWCTFSLNTLFNLKGYLHNNMTIWYSSLIQSILDAICSLEIKVLAN